MCLVFNLTLLGAITNYERGDNPGSTIITVCEEFYDIFLRIAKQALGNRAGKPARVGLAREAHIVAHCIRKEEGHSHAVFVNWMNLTQAVCDRLNLNSDNGFRTGTPSKRLLHWTSSLVHYRGLSIMATASNVLIR